ncbi:unnamed protein product [Echinostoma caproni]|uniref:G_PROTEIN_RECEP_F1_2 domain-containing protein n=1 Tax=Echinostoma caproni TaxID=27848 RepID=A0A183ALB6_9TREM|nr:unnamed protein product [Echinostoma caproni]
MSFMSPPGWSSPVFKKPRLMARVRGLVLLLNLFVAWCLSIPNLIKYKLVEIPFDHTPNPIVYGQVRQTQSYRAHTHLYQLVQLCAGAILWILLTVSFMALFVRIVLNKFSHPVHTSTRSGQSSYVYFVSRWLKMEQQLTLALGVLWVLNVSADLTAFFLDYFHVVIDRARLFVALEFINLYLAALRVIACFLFGAYPRRLLTNIHRFWLFPDRNHGPDGFQSGFPFVDAHGDSYLPMTESKISFSGSLVPMMLKRNRSSFGGSIIQGTSGVSTFPNGKTASDIPGPSSND